MFFIQTHFGFSQVSVCSSRTAQVRGIKQNPKSLNMADYKSQLLTPPKASLDRSVVQQKIHILEGKAQRCFSFSAGLVIAEDLNVINFLKPTKSSRSTIKNWSSQFFGGSKKEKVKAMSTTWTSCT